MNKKTPPQHLSDSPETAQSGVDSVTHILKEKFEGLMNLIDTLHGIELVDGVREKLKTDLMQVLENPSEYAHVKVGYNRDGCAGSHGGALNYNEPWENTDTVGPIMTMLAAGTRPDKKTVITNIEFEKGELPWWAKKE